VYKMLYGALEMFGHDELIKMWPREYYYATPCEQCDLPLRLHVWVTLDEFGFVSTCSIQKELRLKKLGVLGGPQ
jgi:hypothetical protein